MAGECEMKLKIMAGGRLGGPILATEDGRLLPGQRHIEVKHGLSESTVTVEFVITGNEVAFALNEKAKLKNEVAMSSMPDICLDELGHQEI
jgi:hypothetical protein